MATSAITDSLTLTSTYIHYPISSSNLAEGKKPTPKYRKNQQQNTKNMSVATSSSFSCIKLRTPSTPSSTSSSASASSTCSSFRCSTAKPSVLTIRSSQAEGPLRRPVAQPAPVKPVRPQPPTPPQQPSSSPPPPSSPPKKVAAVEDKNVITLEFQRQKAKELQEYFKKKKLEDANQGPFFGFIGKNEITNGRWAMFGFAVGLLTEYATGSNFIDQIKILLSNFGIVDLE